MLRNRAVALLFCCTVSSLAFAVGLGSLQSKSALNEPFSGRIEILGATADDFDTLKASLASPAQFQRAGIDLLPVLSTLRFSIEDTGSGKDYITVTSREPIREPFLNFLLEVNWLNGRLVREYTILLDPPLYDPNRRRVATVSAPSPTAATIPTPAAPPPSSTTPAVATPRPPRVPAPYGAGNDIGPVASGQGP
jgi:pilus assembly protein FimV